MFSGRKNITAEATGEGSCAPGAPNWVLLNCAETFNVRHVYMKECWRENTARKTGGMW